MSRRKLSACCLILKPEGTVVLNTHPIQPVTATLGGGAYDAAAMIAYLQKHAGNLTMLDGDAAAEDRFPEVLNMVMLGAVLRSGVLPLTLEEVTETMERTVKPQFRELNRKALHIEE